MNTTIDELAAEVVSSDSEQERKQRQVHCLETQLESHTSRGVPGTAALMQYDVIRGLRYESGRRGGPAGKDKAADGYYVGLVLESCDGCLYETDDLCCDWVETHFEKSFIRAVKRQSLDKDGGFIGPGCCGFTPVDPGDPNNASLSFIKPIPYSSDGEDTTAPTNYVVKLCCIFTGVPLEKGDVVQDSSTLELHKAPFVVYAQVQLGNDKPGKCKKVNWQWLEEVFGDSPDSNLVDDFLQKNYDKTHRRDSRGGHTHDSLPGHLLPFEVDARQIHAIRWNVTTRVFEGRLTATFGEGEKTVP